MENKEPVSFEITRRVPFYDLDPIQVVWHGNYMNYFEDARVALLQAHGIDLYEIYQRTAIVFPIIRTSTKHILPLRYQDEFVCRAIVRRPASSSSSTSRSGWRRTGQVCTRGRTEQVAVKAPEMEILFSIPDEIRQALGF